MKLRGSLRPNSEYGRLDVKAVGPRWTSSLRSGRSTPRESPAVWYPLRIGRIHEKLPGFLTSGSFSATPSQARRPVVCCFVPGNSGGGRAGLTPASLRKFACGLNTRETRIPCRGHQCAKIVAHRQSFGHPSRLGLAVQSDLSDDLFACRVRTMSNVLWPCRALNGSYMFRPNPHEYAVTLNQYLHGQAREGQGGGSFN